MIATIIGSVAVVSIVLNLLILLGTFVTRKEAPELETTLIVNFTALNLFMGGAVAYGIFYSGVCM